MAQIITGLRTENVDMGDDFKIFLLVGFLR